MMSCFNIYLFFNCVNWKYVVTVHSLYSVLIIKTQNVVNGMTIFFSVEFNMLLKFTIVSLY